MITLIGLVLFLTVVLLLRPSSHNLGDPEDREAQTTLLEERLEGVLLTEIGQSLSQLERKLSIGFTDQAGKAELQAALGRWHAKGKVKTDTSGYRLAR